MCPNCRAFITTDDKVCPYCDLKVGPSAVERRSPRAVLGGLIPAERFTTTVILLINAGLYVACTLYSMKAGGSAVDLDGQTLYDFGAKLTRAVFGGQWWRLVTAGFLHGGILHILMNSWVLFDLGAQVEELFGTSRYLVLYFVSTVAGFLASTYWSPSLSVGASAGIFGLIGAMLAFGLRDRTPYGQAIRGHFGRWAVYGLIIGLLPGFRIDMAAHLGGLAGGFGLAYFAGTPKLVQSWSETAWRVAAGVCLALTAISFALMFLNFPR